MIRLATLIQMILWLLILWLVSCQKPEEEIEILNEEKSFTKSNLLGQYVYGISLLDGSGDNIIDNANQLMVQLPVEVNVKGQPLKINTASDLVPIRELYDLNPYVPDFMSIQFPIKVTKADYSEATISNQEELKETILTTNINLAYDDIECVDFIYPITLAIYDPLNQKAKSVHIINDKSLYQAMQNTSDMDLISFNFPLSISVGGALTKVNDNQELQEIIEGEISICDEEDYRFYSNEEIILGGIKLILTDAPFPIQEIEEANVKINRIDIKTGAENDSVPYITIFNDSLSYNLLDLSNGVTADLSELEIPVGAYDFFRVYANEGSILLKDGRSFNLKVPSGNESGLLIKLASPISITEDGTQEFLFDFDLSRSFIPKGNPNNSSQMTGFNFRPVIRVSDSAQTGALKGRVTDVFNSPLGGVLLNLMAADTIYTSTFSNTGGNYTFLGLLPGNYSIEANKEGFSTTLSEEIVINQNMINTFDFTLTEL